MQKRLNKSILTICLSVCLTVSSQVFALPGEDTSFEANKTEYSNYTEPENRVKVKDLDIDPINTESLKKSVIPDPKQEGKKVVGLFVKTMLAVAFCGILAYVILYFVKKYYGGAVVLNEYNKEMEDLDLTTPATKEEAFKSFLNRTRRD